VDDGFVGLGKHTEQKEIARMKSKMRVSGKRMGEIAVCVFACALMACLACGCATKNSGTTTAQTDDNSAVEQATLTTRTVTFPKVYFNDADQDQATQTLEGLGATDIVANDDGSYTATLPIDKYNALVDTLHEGVAGNFDAMPGSDSWKDVTAVDYADDFSQVTFTLSTSSLGLQDMYLSYAGGIYGCMYQQIAGFPVNTEVVILAADGSQLSDTSYPEAWEKASDQSNTPQFQDSAA
jgi:hypothetical protein